MEDFLFLILEILVGVAPVAASFWFLKRDAKLGAVEEVAEALSEIDERLSAMDEKLDEVLGRKEPTSEEMLREVLEAVKKPATGGKRGVGNKRTGS